MELTDWESEGYCVGVGYRETLPQSGQYHPETTEYYRARLFVPVEDPTYVGCEATGSWSDTAKRIMNALILEQKEDNGKFYLEMTELEETAEAGGYELNRWRIDQMEETMVVDEKTYRLFKDTLTWINESGSVETYWIWIDIEKPL
jgi:hypothetical protein